MIYSFIVIRFVMFGIFCITQISIINCMNASVSYHIRIRFTSKIIVYIYLYTEMYINVSRRIIVITNQSKALII